MRSLRLYVRDRFKTQKIPSIYFLSLEHLPQVDEQKFNKIVRNDWQENTSEFFFTELYFIINSNICLMYIFS